MLRERADSGPPLAPGVAAQSLPGLRTPRETGVHVRPQCPRPSELPEPPPAALTAVRKSYLWVNTWRYVIAQPSVKHVGLAAASFSNRAGLRVFPGVTRLQAVTMYSRPTVIDALAVMRWLGFIYRTSCAQGTNDGHADAYQLCLPRSMDHVPMVTKGRLPALAGLTPQQQRSAVVLGVSSKLTQPGGQLTQPLVVKPSDYKWFTQLTPTTHGNNASTNTGHQHADPHGSGAHASARADDEDSFEAVWGALGNDLDPVEATKVDAMLAAGSHPKAVINAVLAERRCPRAA